ncbi:hypothetical protein CTA1_5074, partial [Colletotrichum tanaceti]
ADTYRIRILLVQRCTASHETNPFYVSSINDNRTDADANNCAASEARAGCNQNLWNLDFDKMALFSKVNVAYGILGTVSLAFTKLSFVLFLLRVFYIASARYKCLLWCTVLFIVCLASTFVLDQFLTCNRVSCLWDNATEPFRGCRCRDAWKGMGGFPAMDAALDICLIFTDFGVWGLEEPLRALPAC